MPASFFFFFFFLSFSPFLSPLAFLIFLPSLLFSSRETFTCPHRQAPRGQRAGRVWARGAFPPELPMSLLSRRPGTGAEWPEPPAEAAGARAQRPALARAPCSSAAARDRRARALGAAASPGAALAHPAAAAEAEPDQPRPETAGPGPRGDSAGAGVQVMHLPPGVRCCVLAGTTQPRGSGVSRCCGHSFLWGQGKA